MNQHHGKLAHRRLAVMKKNEPRGPKKVTVILPHDLWRAASIRALDDESSLQEIMTTALRRYLEGK